MKKKNYYTRLVATGLCFSLFGIGALFLVFFIFPIIKIFSYNPLKQSLIFRKVIQISMKIFVFTMKSVGVISVNIKGKNIITKAKGSIIVANHPSLIDVVILIALTNKHNCIVKGSLWQNPFLKGVVKKIYLSNDLEPEELLKQCSLALRQNNNIIIFPEGTRTVPNKKSKVSRGTAHIALLTETPIVPVYIHCYPFGLLKNQKWYEISDEKMRYNLTVYPKIYPENFVKVKTTRQKDSRYLTKKLQAILKIT